MTSQFPLLDSDEMRNHVVALGRGLVAPATGPERHFLKVLAGKARWASAEERAWVDYWRANADGKPPPTAATITRPPKGSDEPASLIDLAVVAANVGSNVTSVELVAANPLLLRAIEMTTSRPLAELASDPERLLGAINAAKGKYFELLVQERLEAGGTFGDISVAADQKAMLADSMNQPGWDIAITDSHHQIASVVQLKATDSVSYIKETLERYPDFKIITTSEAAHATASRDMVIDSGISNHDIEQAVGHVIDDQSGDFLGNFIDCFHPLFPLIFIVATEGYKICVGRRSVEQAIRRAGVRAKHSLTGGAVGALFIAMGFGWFSIFPAILAAKAGPEGIVKLLEGTYDGIVDWYGKRIAEAKARLPEECVRLAAWLNDKAREEGIEATFSPQEIQKALGPHRWGVEHVDHFADGTKLYWIYERHPAVAKFRKDQIERDKEQLKQYLLRQYSSPGDSEPNEA